jgi:D-arabinose 1-dehydrogenase-like Zn-dependent alcohol dehydrogenase
MTAMLGGLAIGGKLVVIGVSPEPIQADPFFLLTSQLSVAGWYAGTSIDSEDTLAFSKRQGVHSMNEVFPLDRVGEAYERMMNSKLRFRAVLNMAS